MQRCALVLCPNHNDGFSVDAREAVMCLALPVGKQRNDRRAELFQVTISFPAVMIPRHR